MVILDQWADWEAAYLSSAIRMLGQNKYSNKTVSLSKEKIVSIGGFQTIPDYDLQSVPAEYDALILIGGMSWRSKKAQQIKPLVNKCLANGKVLGAICDASGFLGTMGVLNSIHHTGNDLKAWAGQAYTDEENYRKEQAITDHKIITANGTASLEFAKEVMIALDVVPEEKIMEWYHFHKQGYYHAPLPKDATSW